MELLFTTLLHTKHSQSTQSKNAKDMTVLRLATDTPTFYKIHFKINFFPFAFLQNLHLHHPNLPLFLASPITYLSPPLLPLSQNSPRHSPYLFYSFSRSSSTLKAIAVSLMPPPPHWIIKWSSTCKMQWMLSRLCLTWPTNHFEH